MNSLRKSTRLTQVKLKKRKSKSSLDDSSTEEKDTKDSNSKNLKNNINKKFKTQKHLKNYDDSGGSSSSSSSEELFKNPKSFDFKSEFFTSLKSNTKIIVEKQQEAQIASRLSETESDSEIECKRIKNNSSEKNENIQIVSNYFNKTLEKSKKKKSDKEKSSNNINKNSKRKKMKNSKLTEKMDNESMSISQILAMGENIDEVKNNQEDINKKSLNIHTSDSEDWEEVDELKKEIIPTKDIEIQLEKSLVIGKKKKAKEIQFQEELRRHLNRKIRHVQILKHKVHLLCLIAYGQQLNSIINNENIMAIALSLISSENNYPKEKVDINYGRKITSWFCKNIKVRQNSHNHRINEIILEKNLTNKTACCKRELVLMFVSLLRSLGLKARLVISLQPIPLRPKTEDLSSFGKEIKEKKQDTTSTTNAPTTSSSSTNKKTQNNNKKRLVKNVANKTKGKTKKGQKKKNISSDEEDDNKFVCKNNRSVLSSDDNDNEIPSTSTNIKYCDYWAELFLEDREIWICLDPTTGKHDCISHIYKQLTPPVTYILAFNNDLSLKDVTKRYDIHWLTSTQKKRIEDEWWDQTLKPFLPSRNILDEIEERHLILKLQNKPLPTSISEYKDHPLYVLKRHLLKFEALYPNECVPIGYVKSEPVYPRESVYTLHSRETWLKDAKVVKLNEEPYKIVKARPKWDKLTRTVITDQPLEIFGPWQVEDYVPPEAKDGVVPRNCYGNVDLFKPSMLPKGTVHIHGNNLNRVARKLGIDCAPAVTGFDFHSGGCHPLVDGYVICEEYKDTLLDAWRQEMVEAEKRQEEKRQKIIYDRWKLLIKGLLIRERLKLRYDLGKDDPQSSKSEKTLNKNKKGKKTINT